MHKVGEKYISQSGDVIVAEAENSRLGNITVYRHDDGQYSVTHDDIMRHPNGNAETVIRALAFYLMT